jgi:hypothetical protein
MFVTRFLLPGLVLSVALIVSSLPAHVKASNSDTPINEDELLQKYVVLCGQNAPDKIQSMQTLNPVERTYIWRLHLGLYLAHKSLTLTRDQQNIVIETLALISPQLFNPPDPNNPNGRATTLERVDQLRRRGLQVFTKDEAAEIFSAIGGTQDSEALRKYSQLSELSKSDRKASFNLMGADQKASLWRVHFGLSLARHPEWTDQQRSVVLEAIAMVTPELYKIPKDSKWTRLVDEPARLLTQKALLVFSKQEGAALLSELGFPEQAKSNHARRPNGSCACSLESDWCSHQCISAECMVLTWGCGTLALYACNGTCYVPPNSN